MEKVVEPQPNFNHSVDSTTSIRFIHSKFGTKCMEVFKIKQVYSQSFSWAMSNVIGLSSMLTVVLFSP